MSLRFPLATVAAGLLLAAPTARPDDVLEGETLAKLSVTVDPDDSGTILVPSPFTIIPGSARVAIHVPESGGIFVLDGERILHHYPVAPGAESPDDLDANPELLVAGRLPDDPRLAVELQVFDLVTGRALGSVQSRNPHLIVVPELSALWRVVVASDLVGVYQPDAGASYPLWTRADGPLPSAEQMERASAGIGFGGRTKAIPLTDGSVSIRRGGRTDPFVGPDEGEYVDTAPDEGVLFLQPAVAVRSDADGDLLLPREHSMRLVHADGERTDFRLRALDAGVKATRLVVRGRAVRVRGDHVYWIFLGADFLEIRSLALSEIPPAGN